MSEHPMRKKSVWQVVFASISLLAFLLPAPAGESRSPVLNLAQQELLDKFLSFTPPEGKGGGTWMLEEWNSDMGLELFVQPPSGTGNAAAAFKRLEELFPSERNALESDASKTLGVQTLLEAAEIKECRLAPDFYPEFDRITARQPDFMVLRIYLKALQDRAASSERSGNIRDAERCHRAAILCGKHLTNDRSSAVVYLTGLIFKLRGTQEYEKFLRRAGRTGEADAARKYAIRIGLLMRAFNWKANEALNLMDDFACLPVAIKVAISDKEPCWRKEALFRLGILRFGAIEKDSIVVKRDMAFEAMAERTLSQVAARDPDPSVRRFAVWVVQNVKPESYGELEHKFE